MSHNPQSITTLPRALIEAGYDDAPTYRAVYAACLDGRFPAKQAGNGRWSFDPADMPLIVNALGLSDHAAAA